MPQMVPHLQGLWQQEHFAAAPSPPLFLPPSCMASAPPSPESSGSSSKAVDSSRRADWRVAGSSTTFLVRMTSGLKAVVFLAEAPSAFDNDALARLNSQGLRARAGKGFLVQVAHSDSIYLLSQLLTFLHLFEYSCAFF